MQKINYSAISSSVLFLEVEKYIMKVSVNSVKCRNEISLLNEIACYFWRRGRYDVWGSS